MSSGPSHSHRFSRAVAPGTGRLLRCDPSTEWAVYPLRLIIVGLRAVALHTGQRPIRIPATQQYLCERPTERASILARDGSSPSYPATLVWRSCVTLPVRKGSAALPPAAT